MRASRRSHLLRPVGADMKSVVLLLKEQIHFVVKTVSHKELIDVSLQNDIKIPTSPF